MEKKIVTNEDYEWLKGQFIVDRFLRFEIDKHEVFIGLTSNKKRMILSYIVIVDGKIQTSEEQWVHIKETSKFSKSAIEASRQGTRTITLIDGDIIADLVAKYELYVKPVTTYVLDEFYDVE